MIEKLEGHKVMNNKTMTKRRTPTNNGRNNKQWINNSKTSTFERTAVWATGGLNAFIGSKS